MKAHLYLYIASVCRNTKSVHDFLIIRDTRFIQAHKDERASLCFSTVTGAIYPVRSSFHGIKSAFLFAATTDEIKYGSYTSIRNIKQVIAHFKSLLRLATLIYSLLAVKGYTPPNCNTACNKGMTCNLFLKCFGVFSMNAIKTTVKVDSFCLVCSNAIKC